MLIGVRAAVAALAVGGMAAACGGDSDESGGRPGSAAVNPPGSAAASPPGSAVEIDTDRPQLVALDAADGRVRWTLELSKLTYGVIVSDGRVLEAGADACGLTTARVRGIDAGTGHVVWSVDYETAGLLGPPGFAVGDGVVVLPDATGLLAIGEADGVERWRQAFPPAPRPTAGGGVVVVAAETDPPVAEPRVEAFHLSDGTPAWSVTSLPPLQVLDLTWVGEVVFVGGYGGGPVAHVLDGATGTQRWTPSGGLAAGAEDLAVVYSLTAPPAPGAPTTAVPAGTGEIDVPAPTTVGPVVTGLVGLDSATGRERWRSPGDGAAVTPAGVVTWRFGPPPSESPADGSIPMIPSSLTGVDPADGSPRWSTEASLGAVVDDLVLLLHPDETMQAVGVADGVQRWEIPWPADATPPPVGFRFSSGDDGVAVLALDARSDAAQPEGCGD
jgi:outer membrane protein assembly factor BamB